MLVPALIGRRQTFAGRIDEAVALYKRGLSLKPDYADAHSNLGVALLSRGRVDEAVEHYERALALNPDHVHANNNLGDLFRQSVQCMPVRQPAGRRTRSGNSFGSANRIRTYAELGISSIMPSTG